MKKNYQHKLKSLAVKISHMHHLGNSLLLLVLWIMYCFCTTKTDALEGNSCDAKKSRMGPNSSNARYSLIPFVASIPAYPDYKQVVIIGNCSQDFGGHRSIRNGICHIVSVFFCSFLVLFCRYATFQVFFLGVICNC